MKSINPLMTIRNKTILLFLFLSLNLLASETSINLQNPVTGKVVTKSDGLGLPGAIITLKGTKVTAISDLDGNFTINVPDQKSVLVITYTGYKTQEIALNGRTTINISLEETTTLLDDVVVVGYGTQKKGDLTGAITKIKASDLNTGSANLNAAQMLEGRVTGVFINQNTSDPGKDPVIRIRGNGTMDVAKAGRPNKDNPNPLYNPLIGASADPLVIVDGFQLSHLRDMNTISPNDIESFTVLKDASATAIYGSRGANGVIIITTKSGRKFGKMDVNYYTQFGVTSVARELKLLNGSQFNNFYKSWTPLATPALGFDTQPQQDYFNGISTNVNTNWQKEVLAKTAANQSHFLTLQGGSENLKYSVSGNYLTSNTVVAPGNYARYNGKTKIGYEKGKFAFDASLSYTNEKNNNDRYLYNYFEGDASDQNKYSYWFALLSDPSQPVYKPDGSSTINSIPNQPFRENPLFSPSVTNSYWVQKTNYLNASVKYEVLPGLKLSTILGVSKVSYESFKSVGAVWNNGSPDYTRNFASVVYRSSGDRMLEFLADYNKKFNDKNILTAVLGTSQGEKNYNDIEAAGYNFPNPNLGFDLLQSSTVITPARTSRYKSNSRSYFGRVNYTYDDKYLAQFNFRVDGSTAFGKNNKYGYFPSASLGWKINKEDFMKKFSNLWNLKLRLSYGEAGNDNIPNGLTDLTYTYDTYGGVTYLKLSKNFKEYADLKWETIATTNVGIDLGYKNLTVALDLYLKNSRDLLLTKNENIVNGFTKRIVNQGKVENKGVELTLGYTFYNVLGSKMNYVPQLNFAYNRSRVTDFAGDKVVPEGTDVYINRVFKGATMLREEGQQLNSFFLYHFDGVWQTGEETSAAIYGAKPGEPKIRDVNNDGKLNSADKYHAGTPDPPLTIGLANNFYYKNFEFKAFLQGVFGNKLYNQTRLILENPMIAPFGNLSPVVLDRWTPTNLSNTIDSKISQVRQEFIESDKYLDNASYLRLREVNIIYHWKMKPEVQVREFTFGLGVTNVFTITPYKGLNPEVWQFDNQYTTNPYTRTVTASLNVSF
jgi:TonB-linked SusC/RagA family outer membrane protein